MKLHKAADDAIIIQEGDSGISLHYNKPISRNLKRNVGTAVNINPASSAEDYAIATQLFRQYQDFLGLDLCFQGFEQELAQLPEMYGTPNGLLLLASLDGVHVGCVAFRYKDATTCEMKRLYLTEAARGHGIGRQLSDRIIAAAREAGYQYMILDTLKRLQAALHIYRQTGFEEIPSYYNNPLEEVVYLRKKL
jgi:GNAT superfamily N-acetyltransferase